jgi:hypothetical protein
MSFNIAVICTQYYPLSHADVIVTRWLEAHANDIHVGWKPVTKIAALYVAQHPQGDPPPDDWFSVSPNGRVERYDPKFDISRLVAQHYGVPLFPTIRDALTMGGADLAVDAVLLIGEHGDYAQNEFDQKMYPRKELFDAIVDVFRDLGRVLPVFCDKHLTWNMAWAVEMVATIRAMQIPFFAGSSAPMPVSGPLYELNLPRNAELVESLGLFYLHPEAYGIHSIEYLQSIIERRGGGESGIRALTAYVGDGVWEAMAQGVWSQDLFDFTLAAALTAKAGDYRQNCREHGRYQPVAFVMEHEDGHRSTQIMVEGHIQDFIAGVRLRGDGMLRAAPANLVGLNDFVRHFARLDREIQKFFLTGQSPVALERHLLTTLQVATWMHALKQPGQRIATPQLQIAYQPVQ